MAFDGSFGFPQLPVAGESADLDAKRRERVVTAVAVSAAVAVVVLIAVLMGSVGP